jgi:transposase
MVVEQQSLDNLGESQLREVAARLIAQLRHQSALVEKLTFENALLKRMKFAAQSEKFSVEQRSLLEDEIEADLAAVSAEMDALDTPRQPLPRANTNPSASHCPRICHAARSAMSQVARPVGAAAS